MDSENKNTWLGEAKSVKTALVAVLSLLALFLLVKTINEIQNYKYIGVNPNSVGSIMVSGTGEVFAKPDIAEFSVGVSEESITVAEAQEKSTTKINDILKFLKDNGIAEKDIKTDSYNIYPKYEWVKFDAGVYYPDGKQKLIGYVASQNILIKVRKIEDAGKLISGVGGLGATDISGLTFKVEKEDNLKKQARDEAIKKAKADAESLAKSLGVSLVRIIDYSENGIQPSYARYEMSLAKGIGGGEKVPQIPTGENKIVSTISIVYEVK